MQYGVFNMHRCEQPDGQDGVYVKHTVLRI